MTTLRVMDDDPNHLTNGGDSNYMDGEPMPVPSKPQPQKIWSGSTSSISMATGGAKGTAPKAKLELENGEHVQKHLDNVATANSPAGKLQKGEEIQKQMGTSSGNETPVKKLPGKLGNASSGPAAQLKKDEQIQKQMEKTASKKIASGPAAKYQKGEQIQKQMEADNPNSSPSTSNPPQTPGTNNTTTVIPFPFWSGLGWGYFGGGLAGGAGAGDYASGAGAGDYSASGTSDANTNGTTPAADAAPATGSATSQPGDSEVILKLGESYAVSNENFGTIAGGLSLQLNGLTLAVRVNQWDAEQIAFTLPAVGLTKATEGKLQIQGTDHQLLKTVTVTVVSAEVAQQVVRGSDRGF